MAVKQVSVFVYKIEREGGGEREISLLLTVLPDARIYMEVVPCLLGLARALQKSASCRKSAFVQMVKPKEGVATAANQPHPPEEAKCESSGEELDLDAKSISTLLTMVSTLDTVKSILTVALHHTGEGRGEPSLPQGTELTARAGRW